MKMKLQELIDEKPDTPYARIAQMLLWIAPNPENITLHIAEGTHKILIEIVAPKNDRARLIGTRGRTIQSLRTLLYSSLTEGDPDFDVSIPDDDEGRRRRRKRRPTSRRREHDWEEER